MGMAVAKRYWHVLKTTTVFDHNLPSAFFRALGFSIPFHQDPDWAWRYFLEHFRRLSLEIATRMAEPARGAPYWRALYAATEDERLVCIAVALYLRSGDATLGRLYGQQYSRLLRALRAPGADLVSLGFSSDGKRLTAIDTAGKRWSWHLSTGDLLDEEAAGTFDEYILVSPSQGSAGLHLLSSDGRWEAQATYDSVKIYSRDAISKRQDIEIRSGAIRALAFSPLGRPTPNPSQRKKETQETWLGECLAAAGGEWVKLWDLEPLISQHKRRNWIQRARRILLDNLRDLMLPEEAIQQLFAGGHKNASSDIKTNAVVALSHYSREALAFAFLGRIAGPLWLADLGRALEPKKPPRHYPDDGSTTCVTMFHAVVRPLRRDLMWVAKRRGLGGLAGDYSLFGRQDRISNPLIPFRASIMLYESVLSAVLYAMEKSVAKVSCKSAVTSFASFCRLRFAAQLWSYFSEWEFTVMERPELVERLGTMFDDKDDVDTGDALQMLAQCRSKSKSRWGDSYDTRIGLLVEQVITEAHNREVPDNRVDITESLALLKSLGCCFSVDSARHAELTDIVLMYCDALKLRRSLADDPPGQLKNIGKIERRCLAELEILQGHLIDYLALRPRAALEQIVDGLSPILRQRDPVVLRKAPLDALQATVETALVAHLRNHVVNGRLVLDHDDPRLDLLSFGQVLTDLVVKIRDVDPDDLLALEAEVDPRIDQRRVIGFFTQRYARYAEEGVRTWRRDEWEYLAYRLARQPGCESYSRIRIRVAEGCPWPGETDLRRLYRFLLRDEDLVKQLRKGAEACLEADSGLPA